MSARPDPGAAARLAGGGGAEPEEEPAARRGEDAAYAVSADVWPAFELVTTAQHAVRRPPLGGPIVGFDWVQMQAIAAGLGVAWDRETIRRLKWCEDTVVEVAVDRWERSRPK